MAKRWLALVVCLLPMLGCSDEAVTPRPTGESQEEINALPPTRGKQASNIMPDIPLAGPSALQPDTSAQVSSLLENCLPAEQLKDGWIRLYDNQSQLGWFFMGNANWSFENGIITADAGEPSVLCSSFQISDFELLVDFKCPAATNSGIFLRSVADPRDVERECYELNIAPTDNPFPTGSLVKRHKVEPAELGEVTPDQWHTYRVICQGDQVKVWLNDKQILDYTDPKKLRTGHVGLQYREGTISFRNILLRPLSSQRLSTGANWQDDWKKVDGSNSNLKVESLNDTLHIQGGPGQLESNTQWQDAIIQAAYQTASPEVDSGILFRCLAGQLAQGYEMPIYHGPYSPKDIQKQQTGALSIPHKGEYPNTRELVGDGSAPTYVTIIADQGQFSTFVNGVLMQDIADTRQQNTNPRQGCRFEAGPIALEGANGATDVTFSDVRVSRIEH